jgi:hypothetical protein
MVLSAIVATIICQYRGDEWEEQVRNGMYALRGDSVPNYAKEWVDEKGIPYVYYARQNGIEPGNQYNPTIIANYALDYYAQITGKPSSDAKAGFYHCIQWLADSMTRNNNYALYRFYWRQPWYDSVGAPYTSGMTSARAIEAFASAYLLDSNTTHLANALLLMRGFYMPIEQGGFTYKWPEGWWYEEIADTNRHTPRILDGHIFCLTGLHALRKVVKNDSINSLINLGLAALKSRLPEYDMGNGKPYYDAYKKPADKKYHRLLVHQMNQLWQFTGDNTFKYYYDTWRAPLQQPYVWRMVKEGNRSGILLWFLLFVMCATLFWPAVAAAAKSGWGRSASKNP